MNDDLLREDWRKKLITAGDLHDLLVKSLEHRMAMDLKDIIEAKCSVLTPSGIRERMGFLHVCGGGVIGCRCYEMWEGRLSDSERERLERHLLAYQNYIKE